MTTQEFSEQFDTLYNQQYYMLFSIQNPVALDEYEKSMFLTKAQENVVEALYRSGYGVPEGFEKTEYARRILQKLVVSAHGVLVDEDIPEILADENSKLFIVPEVYYENVIGIYGIIYERATFGGEDSCAKGKTADIIPVKHDELHRILRNPFKGPSLRRVLRVDQSGLTNQNDYVTYGDLSYNDTYGFPVELISKYPIADYYVRYVRRPYPIILVDLPEDAPSIEGCKDIMECELNPAVHKTILEEAVKLALASKTLNTIPTVPQPKESKNKDAGE